LKRILVAGASGFLGREVVRVLQSRGHWTRAICRSSAHAQGLSASEILIADALHPDGLKGAANGVDVVFSCLGQTVSPDLSIKRPGYLAVDIPANRNLIKLAKDAGVKRFVYVSVLHADRFPYVAYLYAHAQVAAAVKSSGLSYGIIEPTGFFSHFKVLLDLVESNRAVVFGNGNSKTNPITMRILPAFALMQSRPAIPRWCPPEVRRSIPGGKCWSGRRKCSASLRKSAKCLSGFPA